MTSSASSGQAAATGNDLPRPAAFPGGRAAPTADRNGAQLCYRHLGIAADWLISVGPGDRPRVTYCNNPAGTPDGGEAEMIGDGIRCWRGRGPGRPSAEHELVANRRPVSALVIPRHAVLVGGASCPSDVDMGAVTLGEEASRSPSTVCESWGTRRQTLAILTSCAS